MKTGYLGGTRGYQSAFYRPGAGWTSNQRRIHVGLQPIAHTCAHACQISPLTVVHRRRPGLPTKAIMIAGIILVAALLRVVLSGMTAL